MKIAFIGQKGIPTLYGGVERHVEEIACGLAKKKGYEIYAYARPYYTPKRLKKYKGVNLINLPSLKTKHLDAISHTLLATLHTIFKLKPQVVHYHAIGPAWCLWLVKVLSPKTKIVFTYHCKDYFHKKWGLIARLSLKFGERIGCQVADEIIAVSDELREYVEEHYDRKVHYIPHGVEAFKNLPAKTIKRKWGLEKDNYILVVSRLIRHKGIHYLIEAYQKLETDKKLVITGPAFFTCDYEKEVREMAKDNKNIVFTGGQKGRTLKELYSNAYAFVNPSQHEGFPMVVMEAGSFGKPLLLSNLRCHKDMFETWPVFFKSRDVKDLSRQLEFVLTHPKEIRQRAKRIKTYCRQYYSWKEIVEKTALRYN